MNNVILDQCVGQTINNCRVEQLLSRGRMSVVYRAQQLRPSRPVAFMLFQLPETLSTAASQQFRTRFLREAPPLMRLRHPHLLPFHGYGEWENWPYLITPYRTEGSLATRIKQHGPWSPANILPLLEQITAGLEYAHRNGQIHGMLTPANLLLSKDGSIEIAAVGLQRLVERRGILSCTKPSELQSTLAGTSLCTPKYLAPEYQKGQEADIRSDVYSLGVILVELLRGSTLPGNIQPQEILEQADWRPPTALRQVLSRALAEDPDKRFKRVSDLLTAYAEQVEAIEPEVATEEKRPQSSPVTPLPSPVTIAVQEIKNPIPENQIVEDQAQIEEVWTDRDFTKTWFPAGLPSVSSAPLETLTPPLRSLRSLRPPQPGVLSRRRTNALLAGGLVIGLAGIGGVTLAQMLNTGKTTQTAQAATNPAGGIGQTTQPLNTAVAFKDTTVPDQRQRLLIHMPDGTFIAYKQGCTHVGVLVDYHPETKMLVCPAHGAIFDPAQNGKVITGPTKIPLPQVAIKVSTTGTITLA